MGLFHEVIVSYDVSDNKLRKKVLDALKDYGLFSIQKSVMWGEVNQAEERAIRKFLGETLEKEDRAFLLRAGNASEQIQKFGFGYKDVPFIKIHEPFVV